MAGNPSTPAPAAAAAVGYTTQTFGGNGLTLGSNIFLVDAPGTVSQAGTGILIHGGQNNSYNNQVQTVLTDGTGTTFGNGGYFEATMSFTGTPSTDGGWPSFWGGTAPWTGDRVETDIVEWWGVGDAAPNGIFWPADGGAPIRQDTTKQPLPANFDPSQPHKYAMLWTQESLTFYIDGVKGPNVIPLKQPYDILNDQKILLTLGTGHNNPLTVYSINVWQAPGAVNMVNGVPVTVPGGQTGQLPESPNDMVVIAGTTNSIIDAHGNKWTIVNGKVAVNGTVDTATANVVELAYVDGKVWHENTGHWWWGKTLPTDTWGPPAGTAVSPLSTTPDVTSIVTGSGPDTLVLNISEDAYQGNAQFTVAVDGKQLGGTFTAAALHAAGASQSFTFKGDWAVGAHTVAVNFLNDAWGGTATTDRNLYVDGITYNGTAIGQSAALLGTGSKSFNVTDSQTVPITVTGSGPDTLVLNISEDAYQGNAQFTVAVDGKQLGGTFTATALHAAGASQGFTFKGDWAVGTHTVAVNFLNDAWGGTATTDRNLYVDGITYNGTATGQSAALLGTGPKSFNVTDSQTAPITVTGSGSDTLVLNISEDAYQGNAQFTVAVDGKQLGGTFTATALHAAGASQGFTFKGDWAVGTHTVAVNFLNDAWGGTATTDRNLYVDGITYNGTATGQSAALLGTGPKSFNVTDSQTAPITVTGSGSDTLVLNISEDAYQGNAQFTVSVDGKQLGGTFTATALHASGASQGFTFKGNFGSGQHAVAVNFLNDAWGGTAATDRNLYVNSVSYNGTATGQSATLLGAGPATFTVSGGTTPSVSETGDHGSLQKNLSQTGTYTVGGDTFVLGSGNAASVTLGTGVSQIKFIGASSITLTGGAGQAKVTADAGNNKFIAGTGSLDVTGGGGRDAYVFHANSGLLTLKDFSLAKGDTLTVDKALKGAFTQASDGHGGMMLTFGTGAGHGVDIYGMTAALPAANVLWV